MKEPIRNNYPPDLTVETNMIFVNANIIELHHVSGEKSPLLRVIENTEQIQGEQIFNNSTTVKIFTTVQETHYQYE